MDRDNIAEAIKLSISSKKGKCYQASEAYYHLMGGKASGLTPIQGVWEGQSHWALRRGCCNAVIDLTMEQFNEIPDYTLFRGRGFLTKKPSLKAQSIMDRVKERNGNGMGTSNQ